VVAADAALGLELTCAVALDPPVCSPWTFTLRNIGDDSYLLDGITPVLPVPARAAELLDLAGRWCREHSPQRSPPATSGSGRGRPGGAARARRHAAARGRHARLRVRPWRGVGVHVACAGNAVHLVERVPEGYAVLGGASWPQPGELVLAPGESYRAPTLHAAWSDAGLDGLSARLHAHVRARPAHPSTPRPLTLNVWEAVYFDHDLARLTALADRAAAVGWSASCSTTAGSSPPRRHPGAG